MKEDLWKYEFATYKPEDDGTISLESFLMSIIVIVHGSKQERYIRRIKKVTSQLKDKEFEVNFDRYRSFQKFLENSDSLKSKLQGWRYMDYEMLWDHMRQFNKDNKTDISENQTLAFFALLDLDESGELEENEVMNVLGHRQLLGQDREKQVKEDAKLWFNKHVKTFMNWFKDVTGF